VHKAKIVEWNCDKAEKQSTITKVIAVFPLLNGTQTECQAKSDEQRVFERMREKLKNLQIRSERL